MMGPGAGGARIAALAALLACAPEARRDPPATPDTAAALSASAVAIRDSSDSAGTGARRTDWPTVDSSAPRPATGRDSLATDGAHSRPDRMIEVVTVADSAAGDALYRRAGTCQPCHGARGEGVKGLGPRLDDDRWLHGDGSRLFLRRVILEGIAEPKEFSRGMPAFGARLSASDAGNVAAYVYTLSHRNVTVTHPFGSPAAGPPVPP